MGAIRSLHLIKGRTPSQLIATSFLLVIFTGAILLTFPISNTSGEWQGFLNALFTATSATCVTGLVVTVTATQYTLFGQIVIILLIQIGGLSLMTLVATFLLKFRARLSVQNKIAMKDMLNQSHILDFKKFIYGIIKYTVFFEGLGIVLLLFKFIPEFGFAKGAWTAIFTSISAFCNAGFDNIGPVSLAPYVTDPLVNFTVMGLIVCGGLGFVVWFDSKEKIFEVIHRKKTFKRARHDLSLYSKFAIIGTLFMIFVPAIMIMIIEWGNPATLGNLNFGQKFMASLFESITFRTAGFFTFDNGAMFTATKFLGMICMFIGGSPGGTAGGVKTTTILVILVCVFCRLRGQNRTDIFGRHISREIIVQATMIIVVNLLVLFLGIFLLAITDNFDFNQICFECASALATVGLTTGITPMLSAGSKVVIILLMYVGRIGIMTALMSLSGKASQSNSKEIVQYPEGHVIVG